MAHSDDFRIKVVAYAIHSNNISETSKKFNIGYHTVRNWVILYNKGEDLKHKSGGKRFEKINKEKLKEYIDKNPDKFLEEIAEEFCCSKTAISNALKKMEYTNKKKQQVIQSKINKK